MIPKYHCITVFDVKQTEGKELPSPQVEVLKGSVPAFDDLMEAIRKVCPVPIYMEPMESEANGYPY